MKLILIFALWIAAAAAYAAPALVVEDVGGKTIVRAVAARLAAWRPEQDVLVVVVPANSGEVTIGALPAGIQAEKLTQNGLAGVVVRGVDTSWQVVQDGANWVIRPGAGLKSESIMMLSDGWRVAGQTVKPQSFEALGKAWQVGLVDNARSVAGSVVGAVKLGGAVTVSAKGEPAPIAVTKVETVKIAEVKPVQQEAPSLKPLAVESGAKTVKMEAAEPLKPLGKSPMAASVLPLRQNVPAQGMKAIGMDAMLARIEPASGPAPALPRSLPVHAAGVLPAEAAKIQPASGLGKVAVSPAEPLPAIGQGKVVEALLPKVLGEVYLPGTLVSLTLPGLEPQQHGEAAPEHATVEDMVASVHEPEAHEVSATDPVSDTARVGGTWNQVTLEPIAAALEAAKVSPTVAEPVADTQPLKEEMVTELPEERLLPPREGIYPDEHAYLLQAIAEAPEGSNRERDARMALASFYVTWQRPEEALSVLGTLPKRSDGLPVSPQARLFTAISQLARGEQPKRGLLDQGGVLGPHAKLWQAVAASRKGDYAGALELWPQERGILPQYPGYVREMAQMAQAQALVLVGDRKMAREVIDQLMAGYKNPETIPVGMVRLAGLVRLGTPDEQEGLEFLARAAESKRDLAEAYRAKFQFVRALQQRKDLSDDQVRTYLTDLWFDWRGDDLERDVLDMLGDLYEKANEPRVALQYWQTLVRAYPGNPELGRITERMTNAFLKVFDPENPKVYEPLEYIGMYYDFSELVPNDGRGDLVHEQVSRLLVDANLWSRAVPIIEHQLRFRPLDTAAQGRLSLLLAKAYGNLGEAGEGVKIIDRWQHAATTTALAKEWKMLEADLLLKLKRPKAVTAALAQMPNDDSDVRDRRIEAAWNAGEWPQAIPLLEKKLENVPSAQLVNDTDAQLALFRLAYAYSQVRDTAKLDGLGLRFASALEKLPNLSGGLGAVAAGTGVSASLVAMGPLAPLTTALNGLNRMSDRMVETRTDIVKTREQQQEYNDKMRYMELLPPPAL
ncbi:MAG: hypothetical protein EON60_00785 [Alphaproteobacteria bacterium]|nr:MAG: hypothetical protein EON60_00785 [Alphaproteobacteria bacterium]